MGIGISHFILECLHKVYVRCKGVEQTPLEFDYTGADEVSRIIKSKLESEEPLMIARYGANELSCVVNYLSVSSKKHSALSFIRGEETSWWWNEGVIRNMQNNAGFFPPTEDNLSRFGALILKDTEQLDILGSWLQNEIKLGNRLDNVTKVALTDIEPSHTDNPWTQWLEGKKVLVVHPFADTIKHQYENNRSRIYSNKKILPEFARLDVIRAVQSIGGSTIYKNWFEALEWMKSEIDKVNFDICLIGCGAYGFPLAAHVKRVGKKAIHWGGSLQLLFGIKGKRWDNDNLYNEYWTRPFETDIISSLSAVENGCYI